MMMHLYSALLCFVVHPKHFTIMWEGLSTWMMKVMKVKKKTYHRSPNRTLINIK